MIGWRRQSERITAAATAVLLQAALYLALTQRQPSLPRGASAPRLIARIVTATRPKREVPPPVRASERLIAVPLTEQPVARPITPLVPQPQVARPAIDWQAGIQHEVGAELSRIHKPRKLRFGFPEMPTTQGPAPEFGWDEKSIDRVQRLTHGIFDLGEHCFIRLWPPIPECHFEPANGDLFEHMHDPKPPPGPNTLP